MKKLILSAMVAGAAVSSATAAVVTVSGEITDDTTWSASNQYVMTDLVFVKDDATLTIEPGTIVRGEPKSSGTSYDPGALVICRDGTINAVGTAAAPIIFTTAMIDSDGDGQFSDETAEYDDNNGVNDYSSVTFLDDDPADSPLSPGFGFSTTAGSSAHTGADEYRGLWGGVIILGSAPTNIAAISGTELVATTTLPRADLDDVFEGFIEGLDPLDTGNDNGIYGGSNPNDSSGSFKYVSIRHGGTNIAEDNEINGLTMGGVGFGTLIEYVEVYCNDDDGFEWFGGTANSRFLVSLFNNDDSFDIDEGFTGLGQFWFSLQLDDGVNGDHSGEHDGTYGSFGGLTVDSLNGTDISGSEGKGLGFYMGFPTIYNATYVANDNSDEMIKADDSFGGNYFNSVFVGSANDLVDVTEDAENRVDVADCEYVSNSIAYDLKGKTSALSGGDLSNYTALATRLAANDNLLDGTNPFATLTNTTVRDDVDPRVTDAANGAVTLAPVTGTYFISAGYAGAFDPSDDSFWTDNWTVFDANVALASGSR